jgi:hypothetical protein
MGISLNTGIPIDEIGNKSTEEFFALQLAFKQYSEEQTKKQPKS